MGEEESFAVIYLTYSYFNLTQDCVDDYSPGKFSFNSCNTNDTLKCDNGQCYNITTLSGGTANCELNLTSLQQIGWHNVNMKFVFDENKK